MSEPAGPSFARPASARSRVRRQRKRARYDRAAVHAVFDAALVCHIGFVADGQPYVIPMLYARDGDRLLLHGAAASRLMRQLVAGCEACVSVTLLDGLVLARSAFHSSANYRSVVAFGRARLLQGADKRPGLERLVDKLVPGRMAVVRGPSRSELAATHLIEFGIEEAAVKLRSGPPSDAAGDLALPVWAGVIPVSVVTGEPLPDERSQGRAVPDHVRRWRAPG